MLACNRLRIDSGNGSRVFEYRIENDCVETRDVGSETAANAETEWQRLTPEQISSHVMANTVLARWLRRRMGISRLLRACGGDLAFGGEGPESPEGRVAA